MRFGLTKSTQQTTQMNINVTLMGILTKTDVCSSLTSRMKGLFLMRVAVVESMELGWLFK